MPAGSHYEASGLTRFFMGNTYRQLWTTPIRVPVLDLETYAGGVKPLKEGGGNQTKNLRLGAHGGEEYVFRPVNKSIKSGPKRLAGTAFDKVFQDQVSGLFPAAGQVIAPIVAAVGIPHATPTFVVAPNDSSFGKYRKDFVHRLATIEEFPNKPDDAPGFAGASDIIDTEQLLPLLDSLPSHTIDARAFLTTRLVDFLVDDTDRHHGNFKWARFGSSKSAVWVPIPRDRDHAFNHYDGILPRIASINTAFLTEFTGQYASIRSLSDNARAMDKRFLAGLEKPVWDSIAQFITRRVTNAVIDSAVHTMPAEYQKVVGESFARKLRQRRDGLAAVTDEFYDVLAKEVDVHATDAADSATVTYLPGGAVDVKLESGKETPYFHRRFEPGQTDEVRVYLHNGNDYAVVKGDASSPIRVRVVGGNGTNTMVDSSHVSSSSRPRFYDVGHASGFYYGPDSMRDSLFSRRPWVKDGGIIQSPGPDAGSSLRPVAGFGTAGLGIVPRIGVRWTDYDFRRVPYSTQLGLDAEYATGVPGWRFTFLGDRRLESSALHFTAFARMSDFELVNFYGFGNNTSSNATSDAFRVDQRQWQFRPAVAYALGRPRSDISLGPVVQYSTSSTNAGRLIGDQQPYGFGTFGEAGVRLGLRYDSRDNVRGATQGFFVDMNTSTFPAIWNVKTAFSQVSGSAATYLRLPLPLKPVLALRGGGKKVWGDGPFQDAAFLGAVDTLMGAVPQRYAGDASVFGNSELRVPVASVRTLLPLDIGLVGFADAGRVYLDGRSPDGWHSVVGGGVSVGILDPATGVSVMFTNSKDSRFVVGTGLRF